MLSPSHFFNFGELPVEKQPATPLFFLPSLDEPETLQQEPSDVSCTSDDWVFSDEALDILRNAEFEPQLTSNTAFNDSDLFLTLEDIAELPFDTTTTDSNFEDLNLDPVPLPLVENDDEPPTKRAKRTKKGKINMLKQFSNNSKISLDVLNSEEFGNVELTFKSSMSDLDALRQERTKEYLRTRLEAKPPKFVLPKNTTAKDFVCKMIENGEGSPYVPMINFIEQNQELLDFFEQKTHTLKEAWNVIFHKIGINAPKPKTLNKGKFQQKSHYSPKELKNFLYKIIDDSSHQALFEHINFHGLAYLE